MLLIICYIVLYAVLLGAIIWVGFLLQLKKEATYHSVDSGRIEADDITVIIPFRNEEQRLPVLLESIRNAERQPLEYLFVDDHSDDEGPELIEDRLEAVSHNVVRVQNDKGGKKVAIREAMPLVSSSLILGMDADVSFRRDYFTRLSELGLADLYVLPAIMIPTRWYEHLYEVDLLLVNAANAGIAGLRRPIIASGANMLYRKDRFKEYDRPEKHMHMPSGDDIYLLRDMRDAGADIRLITDPVLAVYTETPQSVKEFLHQRLRWIAKTGDVADHLSTLLAVIQFVLTVLFISGLVYFALAAEWKHFWSLYLLKTGMDLLLFLPYFNRVKRLRSWLYIPLYEFVFPVYSLVVLGLMFWFKPIWKGRKLERNF